MQFSEGRSSINFRYKLKFNDRQRRYSEWSPERDVRWDMPALISDDLKGAVRRLGAYGTNVKQKVPDGR